MLDSGQGDKFTNTTGVFNLRKSEVFWSWFLLGELLWMMKCHLKKSVSFISVFDFGIFLNRRIRSIQIHPSDVFDLLVFWFFSSSFIIVQGMPEDPKRKSATSKSDVWSVGFLTPNDMIPTGLGGGNSNMLGLFTPNLGEDSHFDEHIFQRGWFNHQLVGYYQ